MKIAFLIIQLSFVLTSTVQSQKYTTSNARAEVLGTVSVSPDYKGTSDQLKGTIDLEKGTVDFQLLLSSIKTGNKTRDGHMYDALEIEEFPTAQFSGRILNFDKSNTKRQEITLEGDFVLHGQKKVIKIPATLEKASKELNFSASFSLFITNFGIEKPSVLFLKVDDKHQIKVSGTAKLDSSL